MFQISSVILFTPPSHPPSHSPLCSVLLWACAAALQTHLKSLSGSNPPPSASTSRLLSLPLDLPLMPQNFLLLLLSDSVCWPSSPEMWLMWLFFSLNVAVKSSNFTCNASLDCLFFFFFYTSVYIGDGLRLQHDPWGLLIMHEVRAKLKMDTQNALRGL